MMIRSLSLIHFSYFDHRLLHELLAGWRSKTDGLRAEAIAVTMFCLLMNFVLLQLGGVPDPQQGDGSVDPVGAFMWLLYEVCVGGQWITTFSSLVLLAAGIITGLDEYDGCFATLPEAGGGGAAGIGAGIGAACGVVVGAATSYFLTRSGIGEASFFAPASFQSQ